MTEVLFSDILGTLIRENIYDVKEFGYNSYKKEFDISCRILNEYLKGGNYVALVTKCSDGHFTSDQLLYDVLINFQSRIDEDLRNHLLFFAVLGDDMLKYSLRKDDVSLIIEDGIKYLKTDAGIKVAVIDGKVDAIDIMLKKINYNNLSIKGIADDYTDLDMLAKITDMGGISNLICYTLNINKQTADEIIKEYYNNIRTEKFSEIYDKYPDRNRDFNPFATPEYEVLSKWYIKEKERIYLLLKDGKMNIEEIFIKSKLMKMLHFYNKMSKNTSQSSNIQKVYQIKDIKRYINSLSVYPTFVKYAEEVLQISQKDLGDGNIDNKNSKSLVKKPKNSKSNN